MEQQKDYRIIVLDDERYEIELKLAQKEFEYMPRDVL